MALGSLPPYSTTVVIISTEEANFFFPVRLSKATSVFSLGSVITYLSYVQKCRPTANAITVSLHFIALSCISADKGLPH